MPRTALLASAAAVLAAASVGAAVIGAPVDSAGAAAPFSLTKSQFTQVQKTSIAALKRSNANAQDITALKAGGVAGAGLQGPKGDPGAPGGFDPAKLVRVTGPVVPVSADEPYVAYTLPCPAGTSALSGGWLTSSAATEKLIRVPASYPSSTMTSWTFRFSYSAGAGSTANVTPYAVCAGA
jgi:hypothetical protein